ncbi:MAG TPA: SDR family oxidoreductase [Anaerovoracaceae bacterium]|nr:SDR family oxidoreductase [Anaerovoracaceae bacterium]
MSKRIVITGGNSGIGREAVQKFLEQGDKVVFTSRSTKLAEEMLHELNSFSESNRLYFFQCDSSKSDDVKSLVSYTEEKLGGCDTLVNCAGIFIGGEVHEFSEEDFDLQMNVNVKGIFLTSKYFLPGMLEQKSGSIVNVSSICGISGGYNCAVYSTSKAAVNNLTRSMALDYMHKGIRVNAVCPSATETKMFMTGTTQEVLDIFTGNNPSGRIGTPSEVADLILFLASEKASYINGACISIDGGLSAWTGEGRQDKAE